MAERVLEPTRYEFPPSESGGLALGFDAAQLTIIVGSLFVGIIALQAGLPIWLAAAVVGPFLLVGATRVAGERLTTLAARWVGWWLRSRRGSSAGSLTAVATAPRLDGGGGEVETAEVKPPAWAKGLELVAIPHGQALVGVWRDSDAFVVVLRVQAPAMALRDLAEQEALTSIWGDLLSATGVEGSPVQRISWLARTAPDDGADAAAWLREHATDTVGLGGGGDSEAGDAPPAREMSPMWRSYLEVGDAVGSTAAARDLMAVVRVQPDRARHRLRGIRDRDARQAAAAQMAVTEAVRIGRRLIELGCDAELYTPEALAAIVRTTFDPTARNELAYWRSASGDSSAGVSPRSGMWPLSYDEPADHVRTDGGFHRLAWIEEWPTLPVGVTWLHPLLLPSTCNRTVAMVMEPVSTYAATRAARRARASAVSDAEVRERQGFLTSARDERSLAAAAQREQELVDGHRDMRFAGYVIVTGTSLDAMEDAWATTVHDAGRARLRLRALHGEHWPALAAVLPLGRFF